MTNVNPIDYIKMLNDLQAKVAAKEKEQINQAAKQRYDAYKAFIDLQESNIERLQRRQEENIKTLTALGISATAEQHEQKLKAIEEEIKKAEASAAAGGKGSKKALKDAKNKKKQIEDEVKIKEKLEKAARIKDNKEKIEAIKKQAKEAGLSGKAYADAVASGMEAAGLSADDIKEVKKAGAKEKAGDAAKKMAGAVLDFAKQLDSQIDTIAANQGEIDTRLQGSKNSTKSGSYWKQISSDIKSVAAVSPFVKQEAIIEKVKSMVSSGISYNVEQRAFLATISDKIATTFNAADSTLLRLVRLQQQDSTAARLGMESAMTAFLNNMYETTEYMGAIADGVRKNIEEATALMSAEESIGFEYQVQKWLGSMYSVGMSDSATSAIAGALGKLGAGDISGLSGDGMGNLMIMAANNAGLNISELLADGLDESSTNRLMKAMVEYLAGIYDSSKDSKVLQQQFANVYGLTASDLKAISNLKTDTSIIAADGLSYNSALGQLNAMAASIAERTSMGEMLGNMWSNFQYTMAEGIGSNMITYGLYKAGGMMDSLGLGKITGIKGMMGIGFDTIDVAGIMRTGAMLGGVLSGIGSLATGIGNSFSGTNMLRQLGIGEGITSVNRGNGQGLTTTGGASVSVSGGVTGSGNDITETTQQGVENSVTESVNDSQETDLNDVNSELIIIQGVIEDFKGAFDSITTNGALKVSTDSESSPWSREMNTAL